MRITNKEKLEMVLEHVSDRNSLSHICEGHNYKYTSKLKYWINLYKAHGEKTFINWIGYTKLDRKDKDMLK